MDPCLLTKYDPKLRQMYFMVYVDDRTIFGKKEAREWIKREVKKCSILTDSVKDTLPANLMGKFAPLSVD